MTPETAAPQTSAAGPPSATDVLGAPYVAETIELTDDDEGRVVATLVSRAPQRARSGVDEEHRSRAVLYVHGFNDYFFQTAMGDFFDALDYDFYALDLRKYGRSLLSHQTPNYVTDLSTYDEELDAAYDRITARDGHREVVIVAHSTGGLIVPLWADRRRRAGRPVPIGMVLNSPWLDLQGSRWLRTVGTRVVDRLAERMPTRVVPRTLTGVYVESLHHAQRGEWDFDLAWKPPISFPVTLGWLRAIRRGHALVHRGIDVGSPVLVLTSSRSSVAEQWSDDVTSSDIVLDVAQMARWAPGLATQVTIARLDGAMHEVFLSAEPVRRRAYELTRQWLAAFTTR